MSIYDNAMILHTTPGSINGDIVSPVGGHNSAFIIAPSASSGTGSVPAPTDAGATSIWSDNFNSYTGWNTGASPMTAVYAYEAGDDGISVDPTGGPDGSQAMKITWPQQVSSSCNDDGHLIEYDFPTYYTNVCTRYSVKYDNGFVFEWGGAYTLCAGTAKKLWFFWGYSGDRFLLDASYGIMGAGSDTDFANYESALEQNVGTPITLAQMADGNYHTVVIQIQISSTPTSGDGWFKIWIDDVQKWDITGWSSHNDGYNLFKVPTTYNQGSPVLQHEWMDNLDVWTYT